jgi:hypothetical protein
MHLRSTKHRQFSWMDWSIVILLISLTIFNSQIYYVRILLVLCFFIPFFVLLFISKKRTHELTNKRVLGVNVLIWTVYLVSWFLMKSDDQTFNVEGANVELLTPILFITLPATLLVLQLWSLKNLHQIVNRYLVFLVTFLLCEAIARLIIEPNCFLNYDCRYEAKTVGFFSTTNAIGTSLVAILSALIVTDRRSKITVLLLSCILISTMARAAIISFALFLLIFALSKAKKAVVLCVLTATTVLTLLYLSHDISELITDGSALSKIDFFAAALDNAARADLKSILFGFGANFAAIVQIVDVNDWSPHAPILKSFFYFGLVGVILYLHNLYGYYKLDRRMLFVLLPVVVCGLAGAPIFLPTLAVSYAILLKNSHARNYQ